MDFATFIGVFVGYTLIIVALYIGPGIGVYVDLPSLLIVVGGTTGIILMHFPLNRVLNVFTLVIKTFFVKETDPEAVIQQLVNFSIRARRDGILALEAAENEIDDQFLKDGIRLAVDGNEPAVIQEIMERELNYLEERHAEGASVLSNIGEYAPAMGMLGTLIGLVAMLQTLDEPSSIGPSMALAIITTFYGSIIANFFALPLAGKLKVRSKEEVLTKEIMLAGIMSIQSGDNPRIVEKKLNAFLKPGTRSSQFERAFD
jgi:chemotaxis protein MotA